MFTRKDLIALNNSLDFAIAWEESSAEAHICPTLDKVMPGNVRVYKKCMRNIVTIKKLQIKIKKILDKV